MPTLTARRSSSDISPMHQRKGRSSNQNSGNSSNISNGGMYNSGNGSSSNYDLEGGGRRRGGAGTGGDANTNILEQQNNERINELSEHVSKLKGLTIDIGNEVREQNSLLDKMHDGFMNTRDMLQGSLQRIGTMLQQGGAKHMCYMITFCVFIMIFLYFLMSYKGKSGA